MKHAEIDDPPVSELLKETFSDVRELVKLEVELATEEVRREMRSTLRALIALGVALAAGLVALSLFAMALVFALGGTAGVAAAVGGGFVVVAAVAGAIGYGVVPKNPMAETRTRVLSDVQLIKESIA